MFELMECKDYETAEKLAADLGAPFLEVLARQYLDRSMSKNAYVVVRKYCLKDEFPEAYTKGEESSIIEFGDLWGIAEKRTNKNKQDI